MGSNIILDCLAEGTPEITLEWQKDGVELKTDDHVLIDVFPSGVVSVFIEAAELRDSGLYSCFTFNSFGTAEYEVEVFVTGEVLATYPHGAQHVRTHIKKGMHVL